MRFTLPAASTLLSFLILSVGSPSTASAQSQPPHPNAALSLNGVGAVDPATGLLAPRSSNLPAPPATAASAHLVATPFAPLQLRLAGPPGAGYLLYVGLKAATPATYLGQLIELDLGASFLAAAGAFGANGSFSFAFLPGLPPGFPIVGAQAAVFDPTAPFGIRTSALVTIEARNDLPTLMRNFADAAGDDVRTTFPAYLNGLAAPGFKWSGASSAGGGAAVLASRVGAVLHGQGGARLEFVSLLADATNLSAPPAGAPQAAQSATFAFEGVLHDVATCGGAPAPTTRARRWYGFHAHEANGAWRLDGDQRDADVAFGLSFAPGFASGGLLDVALALDVRDRFGDFGGLNHVIVSGPQLPAGGGLVNAAPAFGGGAVAADAALIFLPPLVEDAGGPRDTYAVTLFWNSGPPSGPYSIPLRAPFDPATPAGEASILAALPTFTSAGIVGAALGTAAAQLTLSLTAAAPPGNPFGALDGGCAATGFNLALGSFFFPALPFDENATTQTIALCLPGLPACAPGNLGTYTALVLRRVDLYGDAYDLDLSGCF